MYTQASPNQTTATAEAAAAAMSDAIIALLDVKGTLTLAEVWAALAHTGFPVFGHSYLRVPEGVLIGAVSGAFIVAVCDLWMRGRIEVSPCSRRAWEAAGVATFPDVPDFIPTIITRQRGRK